MDYRIKEILRSVRSELIDSSAKLQEVNVVYEELNKKIPEKQQELNAVLEEIEGARRLLKELQDRRNVRVFLPHGPLFPNVLDDAKTANLTRLTPSSLLSWETAVDYSRANITRLFWESLREGCIPVVLSMDVQLPFQDHLDWRLASVRIAQSRFPELHFILRSLDMAEVLEMRRMGRVFFERYLADVRGILKGDLILSVKAVPLFNDSFTAPILTPVNVQPTDDEYLGEFETCLASFLAFTACISYIIVSFDILIHKPSFQGFRPIEPGSGVEFSKALGGNRPREQFTVVLLTYNRDAVLSASLERLHRLPYLNKVVVIWNNVDREPLGAWPRLHVPVEFIKVAKNSLNNRFVPWDRIRTEAVLSLDDDIDLKQHEIVFAFRVWRENRQRVVGFPARHHARYGQEMYYNSNHTCQLSIILTGAAFLHKSYLHAYTHDMPEAIRRHVDEVTNCEDIAMNFLVSHITREPPIKTTSKWTLRCPTCTETLSQDESHFHERHECIRLFTRIYGYNPLKFSQFRADSVLFKTRLPPDKQKCFRFV
ncbi:unnamed protein product [Heligmosomoides polygyrus]|uniref:Glyco_transf_64 domain-containing protein n=1 Tax=Heligmosomoides polygyrus TaxID=6339 RepID=A0A3P8A4S5_HELPZ|nr:unnamed protein product [Heligmosomoides polygyrus]